MIQTVHENSLELIVGDELINIPVGKSFRDPLLNNIKLIAR